MDAVHARLEKTANGEEFSRCLDCGGRSSVFRLEYIVHLYNCPHKSAAADSKPAANGLSIRETSYLRVFQDLFPECNLHYKVQGPEEGICLKVVLTFAEGFPIAVVVISEDDKEFSFSSPRTLFGQGLSKHKQLFLDAVHVHQLFRRKGVATRLLLFCYHMALDRKRGLRYNWYLGVDGEASEASLFHTKLLTDLDLPFEGNSVAFSFEQLAEKLSSLELEPKLFSDEEKPTFSFADDTFDQVLDMAIRTFGLKLYDAS